MHKIRQLVLRYPQLSVLIVINVAVWVLLRLLLLCSPAAGWSVLRWCELPCGVLPMLHRMWSLLTYMWVQTDGVHLLCNMLCLCWFGLMLPQGCGWSVGRLYVCGGVCGGLLYAIVGAASGNTLIGSSAAVIAVAMAVTVVIPKRRVTLPVIGPVQLMWITVALVTVDVASVAFGDLSGHVAHLGGMLSGLLAGWQMRKWRFTPIQIQSNTEREDMQEPTTEQILSKVRRSGHSSLTPEERKILFKMSRGK